jgi:glycosyl transferase family 87
VSVAAANVARAPPARAGALAWVAAGLLACLAAAQYRHGQDFGVFWRAGGRFVAGRDLFPAGDGFLAWRYAPGTALLFAPFALLPLGAAKALWFALLAAAGGLVVARLARDAPDFRPAGLALLALSRPLVEEFACGQVNLLVLLAALAAFRDEDRGRPVRAGLLLALCVGLKLSPALLLLPALAARRWRVVGGAALGLVLVALAPLPFYGASGAVALHHRWTASLAAASPGAAAAGGNQSLFGCAARLGAPAWAAAIVAAAVVAAALRAPGDRARRGLLLFATALASPMGWIQNYVLALPALAGLAVSRRSVAAAAVGVALLVPMYDVSGPRFEAWVFDRSLPLAAMALLFVLALGGAPAGSVVRAAPARPG